MRSPSTIDILSSIDKVGLKAPDKKDGNDKYLRGATKYDRPEAFCFNRSKAPMTSELAKNLCYNEKEGALAISGERVAKTGSIAEPSTYFLNSVMFIFDASSVEMKPSKALSKKQSQYDMAGSVPEPISSESKECAFEEVRCAAFVAGGEKRLPGVKAEDLKAVLIPTHLMPFILKNGLFKNALLVPVLPKVSYLYEWPLEYFEYYGFKSSEKGTKVVHPNWSLAIRQALTSLAAQVQSYGFHVTRLPEEFQVTKKPDVQAKDLLSNITYGAFPLPFSSIVSHTFREASFAAVANVKDSSKSVLFAFAKSQGEKLRTLAGSCKP